ncbi:MAG: hypothetical protein PVS2B1_17050 [Candidatus Dormibacteraceae bacterium]
MKYTKTLSAAARWDNVNSTMSSPLSDVLDAVGYIQFAAQHDPALCSIRASAWRALLASPEARSYFVTRGVSLAEFKKFVCVDTFQVFDDDSPADYDVRLAHGEHVYEICVVVDRSRMGATKFPTTRGW